MTTPAPTVTDHDGFERQLLELRKREKAHTCEGDATAGDLVAGGDGDDRVGLMLAPLRSRIPSPEAIEAAIDLDDPRTSSAWRRCTTAPKNSCRNGSEPDPSDVGAHGM